MSSDYTLYYWPIPFRGHFIRHILAHVGARWDEADIDAVEDLRATSPADQPYPFMAPPLLHDHRRDVWISQMPAIALHLGRAHDLITDEAQTMRLFCDASDVLFEITCHHGDRMWDEASWRTFTAHRLPRWMQLHEALASRTGVMRDRGFMFGADTPSLADLALTTLWHTMTTHLPALRPMLEAHAPTVAGVTDRIAATPAIAALNTAWETREPRYCAGQIEASLIDMLARYGA
ncbi:glutathione S-transferase [Marimonas lutisalis]|uniref:glutathione S-transferase family protein n=1 Tax=Marimonas lutisalis TaxID=2545756 RepID=UPI00137549DB|nr:glutathione S-transferase family protein [Marimonas lutisalis]